MRSAYPLRIGHGTFSREPQRRYYGAVDEVMIWERAVPATEVQQIYQLQGGR